MAIATRQTTHGLLNAWQRRMGVNIWHFNQITGPGVDAPVSTPGQFVYVQPEREQIAEALIAALSMGVAQLGFYPRPVYLSEPLPFWIGARWRLYQTKYGYVEAVGQRTLTAVQMAAAITYSDTDGDGIDDLATITVPAGALTDPSEIQIFFTAADSLYPAGDDRWQIEPVSVELSGSNFIIKGHRALFANPALWRRPYAAPNYHAASKNVGSMTNTSNFVTTVDVYRVHAVAADAATLEWEILDAPKGILRARTLYGCCTGDGQPPMTLHYRAGYPLNNTTGEPDAALELAFLRLANAEMPEKPVADEIRVNFFQADNSVYSSESIPPNLVNNPLGIKIGQVEAWRIFRQYALPNGVQPMGGFR